MAQDCTAAKQLMQLMGAGVTTATTIMAMVGNAQEFDSGRQFADWLGLVPGQFQNIQLKMQRMCIIVSPSEKQRVDWCCRVIGCLGKIFGE